MSSEQSNTMTRPRPMTGRICVAPIPASKESQSPKADAHQQVSRLLFGMSLESLERLRELVRTSKELSDAA